jgi:hypothetical protein
MLFSIRYLLPALLAMAGFVSLGLVGESARLEAFVMFEASAGSVLLINLLFRLGARGDHERDEEERRREYFDAHGRWPDEEPPG